MRIEPFSKLDDVSLNATRDDLSRLLGAPLGTKVNRIGLEEFDYRDRIFRFEPSGFLSEVTIKAERVEFDQVSVQFTALSGFIFSNDPQSFEKHGFIVSPAYGVAFDPEHHPWVTVLTRGGLDGWTKH
ncbi:MAG: hypothetical protein ACTIDY_01535 [Halomonadaceae bacterium]|uniref:Uncharacterized protein n=1 Tax=Halomonas colorata TaxID=2742615 RepID=A0ABR9FTW2_9GAMM|nr:hypothetical protein [Halomonas colorata]MBE0462096.1 hypothetical protein [Halomonas colorata]